MSGPKPIILFCIELICPSGVDGPGGVCQCDNVVGRLGGEWITFCSHGLCKAFEPNSQCEESQIDNGNHPGTGWLRAWHNTLHNNETRCYKTKRATLCPFGRGIF